MNKVVPLNKIKWTVFLQVSDSSLAIFTQCVEKLTQSVDPKRTEIIYLGQQDPLFLNTFSHLCEKVNIPYNYADNESHALELSKGNYVLFLTDHTIVTKNILVKLSYAMENSDKENQKTVIVSPTSNEIAADLGLTPFNLDQLQVQLAKQNIPYDYTMKLSMFCIMVRKDLIKEGYNLRELILNANYEGYLTVSANDTIVYHYPEVIDEAISRQFFVKEPKLAILYRIKIEDDYIKEKFAKSLERTVSISNNIYILDDNSKVKVSIFLKEKHPELWSKVTKYEKFSRSYDEKRDYNELMDWAEKDGCNWILCLEGDEVPEDKINSDYLNRFLNAPNPEIFGYRVSHYHFYDSDTMWRVDNPWGKMRDIRLARLFPGKRITKPGLVTGQTGYVPAMPAETIRETGLRIKNYGYVKSEYRSHRKEFYEKIGLKDGARGLDFSYLINSNGMHRYEWVENNSVSVYTPTKTGGDALWQWLDRTAYFADEMLVGNDSESLSDEDLELIKSYDNAKIVPTIMADNFAEGRNSIIKEATCDWIFQLDIDETVEDLCGLKRLMDLPNIDAWMFSITNFQKDGGAIVTDTLRLYKNKDGVKYWGRLHETIDAHVKKSAWKISKSPIKMSHFGYTMQTDEQAYSKMQRYLEINLKQMRENPTHGMAYYNLALHFLEDNLIEDAIKMLEICTFLQPEFPLAGLELGKTYIIKASRWINNSLKSAGDNQSIKQGFTGIQKTLNEIMPRNHMVAPGHCISYFNIHAEDAKWLREHIPVMEKKIEEAKIKMLERRAKGA